MPRKKTESLLTEQEHLVMVLVAKGLGDKQIARQLQVEVCTIRTHLNSVFKKSGALLV